MATINAIFAPVIGPATWGLIHFLWQGSLVALFLAVALVFQGRTSAAVRYRTACFALVLMVTAPVVTALTYQSPDIDRMPGSAVVSDIASIQPASNVETGPVTGGGLDTLKSRFSVMATVEQLSPWIFALWLLGVLALAVIHTAGWRRAQRIKKTGVQPVSAHWQEITTRLCRQMGIKRAVSFAISAIVEVPTVIGWLSPVVLIPVSAFTGLTQEQLRYLLAHEIAHVRRRDYLVNLLQVIAETLLFFHPAVWWVSKQIRTERENCCDDVAVGVCNSRLGYARALVRLEEIRCYQTGFAMRADGGSLVSRIQRLTGGNSMSIHQNKPWLAGLCLATLLIVGGAALSLAVDRSGDKKAEGQSSASVDRGGEYATRSEDFDVEGKWEIEGLTDVLLMQVSVRERGNHWNMTFEFDKEEFTGLDYGEDDQFELHRDAGSFYFRGDFEGSGRDLEGYGKFGFVPDYDFAKEIGLRKTRDHELMILAAKDVGTEYIKEMEKLGYDNLDGDELVRMAIHGVSIDYVKEMKKAGYEADPDELVKWRIHGVSPEFAREMADAGFDTDSADQLVKYRIHGVDPEFVHEMTELGITHMDPDDPVKMKIHGVSPEFVHGMHTAGYGSLDVDELVAWRIHGVSPEYVTAMKEAGVKDMRTRDLQKMRIHGVTPSFVRELNELGYTDVDVDDLVRMQIHGVTASYIKRIQDKTTEDPSIDDLVKMKIHGIHL
jgi:beta-lactamase regulating signal transducer with metallopeptidase domain